MTFCSEPGPATDINATVTTTSLTVSWSAPSGQNVTVYDVELKNENNTKERIENTSTTFDNLLPGKSYTVVVISRVQNSTGDVAEETFTTGKYMCV